MRYYLKIGDYNSLTETCKRLGKTQPSLWLQALTGLRDNKNAPPNLLSQVLQVIGKDKMKFHSDMFNAFIAIFFFCFVLLIRTAQEKLQSPLQVLMCLAIENGPNLSAVREYFLQVFQKDNESAKSVSQFLSQILEFELMEKCHFSMFNLNVQEEERVEKYRKDSINLKEHIKQLNERPIEFRGTLCDTCNQPLTMPSLYFLCKHAYHQE